MQLCKLNQRSSGHLFPDTILHYCFFPVVPLIIRLERRRDIDGSRMHFFPSAFFLFASDLFQAFSLQDTDGGSHPALGCSSISGGRWGWDLLRTLWGGYLLPAHHESTINLCRKFYTVNTSFCLLLQPRISRPSGLTIMQMFVDTQKKLPQLFNILKRWTRAAE